MHQGQGQGQGQQYQAYHPNAPPQQQGAVYGQAYGQQPPSSGW